VAFNLVARATAGTIPVTPVTADGLADWSVEADAATKTWIAATGFKAKAGETCVVPGGNGDIARVLLGVEAADRIGVWEFAGLPASLPAGRYAIDADLAPEDATAFDAFVRKIPYQFQEETGNIAYQTFLGSQEPG
jgi:leucyl aminopeptidase